MSTIESHRPEVDFSAGAPDGELIIKATPVDTLPKKPIEGNGFTLPEPLERSPIKAPEPLHREPIVVPEPISGKQPTLEAPTDAPTIVSINATEPVIPPADSETKRHLQLVVSDESAEKSAVKSRAKTATPKPATSTPKKAAAKKATSSTALPKKAKAAVQTPSTALTSEELAKETLTPEAIERRDSFMAMNKARNAYLAASVEHRLDGKKKNLKAFESASEKYDQARERCLEFMAKDMKAAGVPEETVKAKLVELYVMDVSKNAVGEQKMIMAKAAELQEKLEVLDRNPKNTREWLTHKRADFYQKWAEGTGEKVLSVAGIKNRFKKSFVTSGVAIVPAVVAGVAAGAVIAPLGAGLLGVAAAGAMAKGGIRGAVRASIDRRSATWNNLRASGETHAQAEQENVVEAAQRKAQQILNEGLEAPTTGDIIKLSSKTTLEQGLAAMEERTGRNKDWLKQVAFFAGSSVVGAGAGVALRWVGGHAAEAVSEWLSNRNTPDIQGPATTIPSDELAVGATGTTEAATTTVTTSAPSTTEVAPTTSSTAVESTTTTSTSTSTTSTTMPTTTTTMESAPTTTVPSAETPPAGTGVPAAGDPSEAAGAVIMQQLEAIDSNPESEAAFKRMYILGELQKIDADPASKAAFEQMVHNGNLDAQRTHILEQLQQIKANPDSSAAFYQMIENPKEFDQMIATVESLKVAHPEMTPAQIDQMTLDGLKWAKDEQIRQYLGGIKALEDQSGLKIDTPEFRDYSAAKIREISDAQFAPTQATVEAHIQSSGLTAAQKDVLLGRIRVDANGWYDHDQDMVMRTIAGTKGMSPTQVNSLIVNNVVATSKFGLIADLRSVGYSDEEIAEMLKVYYLAV